MTLVSMMLVVNSEVEGAPPGWGKTRRAGIVRRVIFTEVAARWIPPDVFGSAFRRLFEDDDDA